MDERIIAKIYKSSLKFLVYLNPEETYTTIIQETVKLVDADGGVLYLGIDKELIAVYSTISKLLKAHPGKKEQPV